MKRSTLGVIVVAATLATVAAVRFGGWAVVTVESVPDYLVVNQPTTLTFGVRQHAVSPLTDLSPQVIAKSGKREVSVNARNVGSGRYRVDLSVPETGDWRVMIDTKWLETGLNLLPIKALASAPTTPIVMTDAERGRILFAGKGCVTCHFHSEVGLKARMQDYGPNLTDKRFAPTYLAEFLANPSIKPAGQNGQMPRPDLRPADIPLLVAFINSERKTAAK